MKVYFIGAGPGAPDLITIRGAKILSEVTIVLYAGSLVPEVVLTHCSTDATKINTASLNLDQQVEQYKQAKQKNQSIARVHSGDPSIYGAMAEQMKRLGELEIEYEVVPGVSSFTAAAAILKTELTKPDVTQTVILTRLSGRASAVPDKENLASLAAHQASLCIFLSGRQLQETITELSRHYKTDTPIAFVYRATWPDERIVRGTLASIMSLVNPSDWTLTTIILVGDVMREELPSESCLYSPEYAHKFRKASTKVTTTTGGVL